MFAAFFLPLALMAAAWQWGFLPAWAKLASLKNDQAQFSANVYEKDWLDSAQAELERQLSAAQRDLSLAKSRLMPMRPFQQTLDILRKGAGEAKVEVLETQVSTTRKDSLRTMLLKVHARGEYAGYWLWLKGLEKTQPWWSVREMTLKPIGEGAQKLDGLFLLAATGPVEILP